MVPVGPGTLTVYKLNGRSSQHCGVPERQAVPVPPPPILSTHKSEQRASWTTSGFEETRQVGTSWLHGRDVSESQENLLPADSWPSLLTLTGGGSRVQGGTVTWRCDPRGDLWFRMREGRGVGRAWGGKA